MCQEWYYRKAGTSLTVKRHSSAFMKITKHRDIASEKIPFTWLYYFLLVCILFWFSLKISDQYILPLILIQAVTHRVKGLTTEQIMLSAHMTDG